MFDPWQQTEPPGEPTGSSEPSVSAASPVGPAGPAHSADPFGAPPPAAPGGPIPQGPVAAASVPGGYLPPPMYGFAYAPPPPPPNGLALAGLITAILFWPAGLLLSYLGLRRSRRLGGAGRGQAVAGLVVAPVSAVVTTLLVVVAVLTATALNNADRAMFGPAPSDPGCTTMMPVLTALPGEVQDAAADPSSIVGYLAEVDRMLVNAERSAANVEVASDLSNLDEDVDTVTGDLQAIEGGGTADSTGLDSDIAGLDADADAMLSLCSA